MGIGAAVGAGIDQDWFEVLLGDADQAKAEYERYQMKKAANVAR